MEYIIPFQIVHIKSRSFIHEYKNPPELSDLTPGDVFLIESQLSSIGPHSLHPIVFMGGVKTRSITRSGFKLTTFKYKFLGTARVEVGNMIMTNIYLETWP